MSNADARRRLSRSIRPGGCAASLHSARATAGALLCCLGAVACGGDDEGAGSGGEPGLAIGQRVPFPTASWTTATPAAMGMDAARLDEARQYAFRADHNTQSVVVVRGGAVVAQWHAEGYDADSWSTSWSVAKSFTSTLVGIAVDSGLIADVEAPLSTFYTEWEGAPKGDIPLRSVLQMQSGLRYHEDYVDLATSDTIKMGTASDALGFVETLPVDVAPDERWSYSSADTMILGGVIERATGKTPADYAREVLFDPLGMHSAAWWRDGAGHTLTFCCIDAPSLEFAKMGLLFLRGGAWDGRQIVSKTWVERATTGDRASRNHGYAYQWWNADIDPDGALPRDLYSARGEDDQYIYVIPSLDLVVVRTGIFEKPPTDTVAERGFISEMLIRGLGRYGTLDPVLWEEEAFLGRIINSIDGAPRVAFTETTLPAGTGNTAECRQRARDYGTYCEAVHGCACERCPAPFETCDGHAECKAIMQCALEVGCRGFSCFDPCREAIDANGGALGTGAQLALALSDCVTGCATTCE